MSVYVKKGTPMHGPSLCETCYALSHRSGLPRQRVRSWCARRRIPKCLYSSPCANVRATSEQGRQTLRQMEDIAWTLVPRGPKRQAGFVAPADLKEGDREIELVLDDEA